MSRQKVMVKLDRTQKCESCDDIPFIIFHAPAHKQRWMWLCPKCWISEAKQQFLGDGRGQVFYNKSVNEVL